MFYLEMNCCCTVLNLPRSKVTLNPSCQSIQPQRRDGGRDGGMEGQREGVFGSFHKAQPLSEMTGHTVEMNVTGGMNNPSAWLIHKSTSFMVRAIIS